MHDVFFAFYGEGKADYEFLLRVIVRSLKELVPDSDFEPTPVHGIKGATEMERQAKLAADYAGLHFIIIHLDADSRTEDEAIENRLIADYKERGVVPIIPIKETEAWILADFSAFKDVLGIKLRARELNFPEHPHQVEAINEPKELIKAMLSKISGRRRIEIDEIYEAMGEQVSFAELAKIPAFQNFRKRIIATLIQLGFRELEAL